MVSFWFCCVTFFGGKSNYAWLAPIQIEIAECGAADNLLKLVKYDEEDDGTITMAIKALDSLASEGKYVENLGRIRLLKTRK